MNTEGNSQAVARAFWRDLPYGFAVLAGPVCWLVMLLAGVPRSSGAINIILLFQLVLLMPVLEEIVFRQGVQTGLYKWAVFANSRFGISIANLVTSILFAAMHLFNQPPVWAALIFFPSLLFGWARDRFDSVLPAIVLHCVYNAGFVLLFVNMT